MYKFGTPIILTASVFAVLSFVPLTVFDVESERVERVIAQSDSVDNTEQVTTPVEEVISVDTRETVSHVPLPQAVKAIYMTSCVAATDSFRQKLVTLIRETEVNSVVIDIKDYSGTISFPAASEAWKPAWEEARCGTRDMPQLIELLHDHNIFVIGRITVFQDPFYAPKHPELAVLRADQQTVWTDGKGLSFIDVAAKPYWDHLIELVVDSYNIGFDELNFDYVRYPSDGNMADTYYPQSMAGEYGMDRQANLEAFFKYLNEKLSEEDRFTSVIHENTGRSSNIPYTSADLFGMTTTNFDDLSIGQVQDRTAPYFDFVAPMVYPSHYPNNFLGLGNPNDYPYEVVNYAMQAGVNRMISSTTPMEGFLHTPVTVTNASGTVTQTGMYNKTVYGPEKFRTWIQDFDYGGDYDAADVRAQIQASYDAGVDSWMIWAPSNIYTRAALKPLDDSISY
jgi:hypothetical protein